MTNQVYKSCSEAANVLGDMCTEDTEVTIKVHFDMDNNPDPFIVTALINPYKNLDPKARKKAYTTNKQRLERAVKRLRDASTAPG